MEKQLTSLKINNMETIKVIEQGALLPPADLEFLYSKVDELTSNANKNQIFRTDTEARISVLDDIHFPTRASKYWQAIREQSVFYNELVALSFEHRRLVVDIAEFEAELSDLSDAIPFTKTRIQIDLDEALFKQQGMERIARDRCREVKMWDTILHDLDDGSFDTDNVNTHQLLSYVQRFEHQMTLSQNASPSEQANLIGQLQTATDYLAMGEHSLAGVNPKLKEISNGN